MKKLGRARLARHDLAQGVRRPGERGRLRVPPERGARAARRAADRQGRRHHRQDADPPRQREAEARVPAEDPRQRGRVRDRLQRAAGRLRRGRHAAQGRARGRRLAARTARRSSPPRRTSRSGTGSARAPIPTRPSTTASACSCCRWTPRASPCSAMPTIGERDSPTRSSSTTSSCHDDYLVGERDARLPVHLGSARSRALHDVHVLADRAARRAALRLRRAPRSATASRCARTRSCARRSRSS